MFNVGPGDRKIRARNTAFIAPNKRRTVRKREHGMQMRLVPVQIAEIEMRKATKKLSKGIGSQPTSRVYDGAVRRTTSSSIRRVRSSIEFCFGLRN
jgi:hypothetical protein